MNMAVEYLTCFIILFWIYVSHAAADASAVQEICSSETFKAKCSANELIVMDSAIYGRMRIGRCVKADLGFLGCKSDVLDTADSYCSGKAECEIRVPNGDMDKGMTCYAELSRYLEAKYTCVKSIRKVAKCTSSIEIPVISQPTHIPSTISIDSDCGGKNVPWILEASPGQSVNLTLIDFNWNNMERYGSDAQPLPPAQRSISDYDCPIEYGYIIDFSKNDEMIKICGGGDGVLARTTHLYESSGHRIQVVINQKHSDKRFLIQYHAVGCPDLVTPQHAWAERNSGELVVGCSATRQTWHLKCHGNRWIGVIGNCSQYLPNSPESSSIKDKGSILETSVAILIIISIATGISCTIIVVGVFCYKKLSLSHKDMESEYQCSTFHTKSKELYNVGDGMEEYHKGPYHDPNHIYPFSKNEYTHIWDQQNIGSGILESGDDLMMQSSTYPPLHDAPLLPKPRATATTTNNFLHHNNNNSSTTTMDMSLDFTGSGPCAESGNIMCDYPLPPHTFLNDEGGIYRSSVSEPSAGTHHAMSQYYGSEK